MGARIIETHWGHWPAVELMDDALQVVVVPAVGGRVISLRDRRSGREWMTAAIPPTADEVAAWSEEGALFGGRESVGWDECLPTVSICADPLDPAAPPMRDHGDQWGRAADVALDAPAGAVTVTWSRSRWPYRFARRLALQPGGALVADYTLTSLADRDLPILWSMHPTFRLEPGTRIEVPGASTMRLTTAPGWPLEPTDAVPWPVPREGIDLSTVGSIADGKAAKLYATPASAARAIAPDGATLALEWDAAVVPAAGIWLDFGAWPPGGPPVHQVALEPTSSGDDQLVDALAHGRAWMLPAGGELRWAVRIASAVGAGPARTR
jgi:galactose mutarotase-like enzyme